ncbi:MAG: hypothetical protein ACOH12_09255 [Parvibaculaceae bacterium]
MKKSSVIAGIVLVVAPLIIAYQFFHWKAEQRLARDMAYVCAGNSDYLVDPLDLDINAARIEPELDPATGKDLMYKGQTVKMLRVPSLYTQDNRYGCAMYKDAGTGHWTVIPRRILRDIQSAGGNAPSASAHGTNPFSK